MNTTSGCSGDPDTPAPDTPEESPPLALHVPTPVNFVTKGQRLDALSDRISMCALNVACLNPDDPESFGPCIVELRGLALELEHLREAGD